MYLIEIFEKETYVSRKHFIPTWADSPVLLDTLDEVRRELRDLGFDDATIQKAVDYLEHDPWPHICECVQDL